MPNGETGQTEARIGNPRHPRIGDQCDLRPPLQVDDQLSRFGHLIVLVIADGASRYAVVIEQLLRLASVFTSDEVNTFQHPQGTQRNVLEIADRRGHQVERRPRRLPLRHPDSPPPWEGQGPPPW